MPLSEADRRAKLQKLHDLAQGSEEFEGGEAAELLAPVAALGSPDGALAEGSMAERDEATRKIPDAMLALWALRKRA